MMLTITRIVAKPDSTAAAQAVQLGLQDAARLGYSWIVGGHAHLLCTVRSIARRKRLEAEPFFIVVIIAAIRCILIITAECTTSVNLQDPHFQAGPVELGLLALIVLALAGAVRLIPAHGETDP